MFPRMAEKTFVTWVRGLELAIYTEIKHTKLNALHEINQVDYAHYTDCTSVNVCRVIEYYQGWLSENAA
jgi:hypothetical protein